MSRVYNFSAGPSCLPEDVLKECAAEMLDYHGTGQSVMEMSHRSKVYKPIIEGAEAKIRSLMKVPDNYKILFLQGGGSTQFAMVAQNLAIRSGKAAYINTNPNKKRDILISIFFMSKYTSTANAITAKAYIKNTSIILPLHSLYTFC